VLGGGLTVLVAIAMAFYLRRMQAWVKIKMAVVGPQPAGRGDNRSLAEAVTHRSSTSLDPPLVERSPLDR